MENVQEKVHDLEQKLQMAAEFGKQLLETNSELTEQQDKQAKEHRLELEKLEQEKYSLQMRIEQKSLMEKALTEDVENLQTALQKHQQEDRQKEELEVKITKLKQQVRSLQTEHDKVQLSEKQLRERAQELDEQLDDMRQQLSHKVSVMNETCSEETAGLHLEITKLHGDKLDLLHQLADVKAQLEQQQLELTCGQQQLHSCQSDLDDQRAMASSYYMALEKCREEGQELRAEMELLKMETQSHKKKGNSLFGELEDRRVEAEKELISVKVSRDSFRKQFEVSRQQMHKLKLQMSGLLMMSGQAGDGERLESLQRQLSHARSQLTEVTSKLHKYEQKEVGQSDYLAQFQKEFGANSNMKYTEYLLLLLERKQKEVEVGEGKLRTKELQLMTQGDLLMNSERRGYDTQKQLQAQQGQNIKLQVKLEELQLKYEPDSVELSNKVRKVYLERIPLEKPSQDIVTTQSGDEPKPTLTSNNEPKSQRPAERGVTQDSDKTARQHSKLSKTVNRKPMRDGKMSVQAGNTSKEASNISKEASETQKGASETSKETSKISEEASKNSKEACDIPMDPDPIYVDKNKTSSDVIEASVEVSKDSNQTSTNTDETSTEPNEVFQKSSPDSKEANKRVLSVANKLGSNPNDSLEVVKPKKTRKVTISDKEDVFEVSGRCLEGEEEEEVGGDRGRGQRRQRPKGRVNTQKTVHVTDYSGRPECETQ